MGGTHGLSIIFTRTQIRCVQWHQLTESRGYFSVKYQTAQRKEGPPAAFLAAGAPEANLTEEAKN